jgi:hypothetical protein
MELAYAGSDVRAYLLAARTAREIDEESPAGNQADLLRDL